MFTGEGLGCPGLSPGPGEGYLGHGVQNFFCQWADYLKER